VYELRHDWWVDGSVTGVAGLAYLLSEGPFKDRLAPATCRWCDRLADGTDALNGFDAWGRGVRWSTEGIPTARRLSDVTGIVAAPLLMLGLDAWVAHRNGALAEVPVDYLIIIESAAVAAVFTQVVKFLVARQRPYAHALSPGELDPLDTDSNVSFFSGHTQLAFTLAVATGTVAELRGYEGRWLIWAVGLPLAALTGYLRMGADKHYLSDVLTGAAVGSALGFLIPTVFHGRTTWKPAKEGVEAHLSVGPGGLSVVGRF
jgi:membrane-associated phospholipid phosphatase